MPAILATRLSAAVSITGITFTVPSSGNNGTLAGTSASTAFVDDIFLDSISYDAGGGATGQFDVSSGEVIVGQAAIVRSGASFVNAEFGDQDTNDDGNPNPFFDLGIGSYDLPVPSSISESTDPAIQNAAITNAVASYSLTQGVDGEGPAFTFDVIFENGVLDNDAGSDLVPELVFLERGFNSSYSLRAIIGGTQDNPIYSSSVSVSVSDQQGTGIYINTNEIGSGQQLAAYGIDASDFGLTAGQAIFGVSITSTGGTGADITAQFITAASPDLIEELPPELDNPAVPEPSGVLLLLLGLVRLAFSRNR